MDTHLILAITSLLSTTLFCYSVAAATPPDIAPSPVPSAASNLFFIRNNCQATLYPDLCFTSLYRYAAYVQEDPALLARAAVAVGVSLNRAKRMANYVQNLSHNAEDEAAEPRVAAALQDCFEVFSDAVDQIRDSLQQMFVLDGSGDSLRFQLSNVQTYMSAALTNEDTCTDGFEEINDGPVKKSVCNRSEKVMHLTSNALALVNNYVSKVTEYYAEP